MTQANQVYSKSRIAAFSRQHLPTSCLVVSLFASISFCCAQEHFQPVEPTGRFSQVLIQEFYIEHLPASENSEVGVFDGAICVGAFSFDGNSPFVFPVIHQFITPTHDTLQGAILGDSMIFKVWDPVQQIEMRGRPQYSVGSGHFPSYGTVTELSILDGGLPSIAVIPDSLDFGSVRVGSDSALCLTVQNVGTFVLTIDSIFSSVAAFHSDLNGPVVVLEDSHIVSTAHFTPPVAGIWSANLELYSDAENSPSLIWVTGQGVEPLIHVSPDSLAFGDVRVDDSLELNLTIRNIGTAGLTISNIESPVGFITDFENQSFVEAGDSLELTVSFLPVVEGTYEGNLEINNDSSVPIVLIPLLGHGVIQEISVNPTTLNFGDVFVGRDSMLVLTISNTGSADLTVSAVNASDVAFSTNAILPRVIQVDSSWTVEVTFSPDSARVYGDTLRIISDAPGSPTFVSLLGSATIDPVGDQHALVPDAFYLGNGFPNPFNPSVTIPFGIPHSSNVKIVIFDLLGREVDVLLDAFVMPGNFQAQWSCSECASGIYLVVMSSPDFRDSQRLLFLK